MTISDTDRDILLGNVVHVFFKRLRQWTQRSEAAQLSDQFWQLCGERSPLLAVCLVLTQFFSDLRVWQKDRETLPFREQCWQRIKLEETITLPMGHKINVVSFCQRVRWHDGPCMADDAHAILAADAEDVAQRRARAETDWELDTIERMYVIMQREPTP